jgi:myosin-5
MAAGEAALNGGGGGFRMVEAKYPALLFKQQLDAFVQKLFPMMRDNVKKNITPMLVSNRCELQGVGVPRSTAGPTTTACHAVVLG